MTMKKKRNSGFSGSEMEHAEDLETQRLEERRIGDKQRTRQHYLAQGSAVESKIGTLLALGRIAHNCEPTSRDCECKVNDHEPK